MNLNKKTEQESESNEKLAEQQQQISEKLDNLTEQMKEAAEMMDKKDDSESAGRYAENAGNDGTGQSFTRS